MGCFWRRYVNDIFNVFALLVVVTATKADACTIFVFSGAGFAANAFAIAHMVPIFHKMNGTLFIDNKDNYYKCSEEGGWHDFFAWEEELVPWTAEAEAEEPDAPCIRHDIGSINKVVFEDLHVTWDELDYIGIKKAGTCPTARHDHHECMQTAAARC